MNERSTQRTSVLARSPATAKRRRERALMRSRSRVLSGERSMSAHERLVSQEGT